MGSAQVLSPRARQRLSSARGRGTGRTPLVADWLTLAGGAGLLASLFLTWSHQLPPPLRAMAGGAPALRGVPSDPTAWQVYSIADVALAALAASLVLSALLGKSPRLRVVLLAALAVALAFTLHALSVAPTNGALLTAPGAPAAGYLPDAAAAGVGETVALVSLGLGASGLALSLIAE